MENNKEPKADWLAHRDGLFIQASKGMMVLNAGAVVAVLGLLQAMYGKGDAVSSFKCFALFSSFVYLVGAMSAIWMTWMKFWYSGEPPKADCVSGGFARLGKESAGAFFVSVIAFCVGTVTVLLGVAYSIH